LTPRPLDIRIEGRRIEAIELAGDPDRAPAVLLHEGLGSAALWRGFPEAVRQATGRRVIAYSRFGHGRSDPPARPRTPAFFHEEALDVLPRILEQASAQRPLLIGHSDGASIALIYAGRHPVAGLALLAPHVFVEPITTAAIVQTRKHYVAGDLRARMARHHDDVDTAFWGWCAVWLDPAFATWSLEPESRALDCPTLLVQGLDDPYGTLAQLDRIEAAAAGPVRRRHVSGGHNPHVDARDETLAAIAELSDGVA
jgi:pimeloyl-ACP methyl ester carboxylesterase